MVCPVCYSKIKKDSAVCPTCKFHVNDLNFTSNKEVKRARKEGRYDDVIYVSQFPKDLNYKKTFYMAVFGGWFGLHNFYVSKTFKAYFNLLSLILSLLFSSLVFTGVLSEAFMSVIVYISILYVVTIIMWVIDLVNFLTKSFKVPVVIKKKGKNNGK